MSYTTISQNSSINILREALKRSLEELGYIIPKVMIVLLIILIFSVIAIVLTKIIRKVMSVTKIEELLKPYVGREIPLTTIIVLLVNLGIALIALHTAVLTVYPEGLKYISLITDYIGRIISVAFLVTIVFIAINTVMERIKMERGLKGFMTLLTFLIVTVLIVDITSLSREVKSALTWGLSLGIGLSIGVFTLWYFFGEYLREFTERRKRENSSS